MIAVMIDMLTMSHALRDLGIRMAPFNMQNSQLPFVQHDAVFPQLGQVPATRASFNYQNLLLSPYRAMGLSQASGDALGTQWPMQSMMYAQSYHRLRHGFLQGPFRQQPLSFDYSQHHR